MELLMIALLIAAVIWMGRTTTASTTRRVREMEDEALEQHAAEDRAKGNHDSAVIREIARRSALMARLAQ